MSTGTATTDVGQWARLRTMLTTDPGRPALLGFLGSVLITVGGLGAGSTRLHDPLLETMALSWLRYGHGLVVSSVVLWTGVLIMLAAWLGLGRRVLDRTATGYTMVVTTGFWLAPLLLSVPVFSRDTYSYLAQGALLRDGLDPYVVPPVENPNPLLDDVSPVWMTTTAPYGPAFILIAKLITALVGNNVVVGTALLRLCMLPGLALLMWATPWLARHVGGHGPTAMWICVLNPLVLIHLMGGVHNEMLMVGLMSAGIALTFRGHPLAGHTLVAVAAAIKATAGIALPFLAWVWVRQLRDRRGYRTPRAVLTVTAAAGATVATVFAVLSLVAGVGFGWLTALSGSARIINWLSVPTAAANLTHAIAGLVLPVNFYAMLEVNRLAGLVIIAVALPLLWWRYRADDRAALTGLAWAMLVVVLFVPAALPWYYSWPLAVAAPLITARPTLALIAGLSTWVMVIFKPDGAHGMYSWAHVAVATGLAVGAWYWLGRVARVEPADSDRP